MQVKQNYPTPTLGVSTLTERNRPNGMLSDMLNMQADTVKKLTRRPSLDYVQWLSSSKWVQYHEYETNGVRVTLAVDRLNEIMIFEDDQPQLVVQGGQVVEDYLNNHTGLQMHTIEDTTFIVNPNVTVAMTDELAHTSRDEFTWINIVTALNYGEELELELAYEGGFLQDGITQHVGSTLVATLAIPDVSGSDFSIADKARATAQVATDLRQAILDVAVANAAGRPEQLERTNVTTVLVKGSTIGIRTGEYTNPNVTVTSGQGGKSVKVFNHTTQEIEGIPKYAVVDSILTVEPSVESTDRSRYYLKAHAVVPLDSYADTLLYEVTWEETTAPDQQYVLDGTTMPVLVKRLDDGSYTVTNGNDWTARDAGNESNNKVPDFVGKPIVAIDSFQGRLAIGAGNVVTLSQTDDIFNMFKQSVLQLLATDRVSIRSRGNDAGTMTGLVEHSGNLLVNFTKEQHKISGAQAITANTASMVRVASFNTLLSPNPLPFGRAVLLPFSYGNSGGVYDFDLRDQSEQYDARAITKLAEGFIVGDIQRWAANAALGIVVVMPVGSDTTLYVYEQEEGNEGRSRMAWSRWEIADIGEVIGMQFVGTALHIIAYDDRTQRYSIELGGTPTETPCYLDRRVLVTVAADATSVSVPALCTLRDGEVTMVLRDGSRRGNPFTVTLVDGVAQFPFNTISGGNDMDVWLGLTYKSRFVLPRAYVRDRDGEIEDHDRLRVKYLQLHVHDTYHVRVEVETDFVETLVQDKTAARVGTVGLGVVPTLDGVMKFPINRDASMATISGQTETALSMNVIGVSWTGMYHKRMSTI